jgi:hypothetical protein
VRPLRWVTAAGLAVAFAAALPESGRALIAWPPLVQDATHPRWRAPLAGAGVREVVLDSRLAHAAGLAPGTPVVRLRLREDSGREAEWIVRSGTETGEWAARRPGVAGHAAAPAAWRVWVEPEGFFGSSYRARFTLPSPLAATSIELARPRDLPAEVELVVERLELRP